MAPRKSLPVRLLYAARDLRSRALYDALLRHSRGHVLDVGGWDFFLTALRRGARFERWTCLEADPERALDFEDERFELVVGDGCRMDFADGSFDTVLCIQVCAASPTEVVTDSLGVAATEWTVGLNSGVDTLVVAIPGSTVVVTATVR